MSSWPSRPELGVLGVIGAPHAQEIVPHYSNPTRGAMAVVEELRSGYSGFSASRRRWQVRY